MTIEELINELRKYPPKDKVGWQDHDASDGSLSNHIKTVSRFKPDGSQSEDWTRGVTIVLKG